MKSHLRRNLLANVRDVRVLLREFRLPMAAFGGVFILATLAFRLLYVHPETGRSLSLAQSVYTVFYFVFAHPTVPFPDAWFLRVLVFLVPILGLGALGEGIIRFGVLLFNKQARLGEWQVALASTYTNHLVVCGVGRLGFRVIGSLVECGEEVVAIAPDEPDPFLQKLRAGRVPVILGDARDPDVLRQAGVDRARTLVVCSENDVENLETALAAREINAKVKVVLRMFEHGLAKKVESAFGIEAALSTSALAAPAFAAAATDADVSPPVYVGDTPLHTARLSVPAGSPLVGQNMGQLERDHDLSVILHERAGKADMHPPAYLMLQPGDQIVVFATLEVVNRFQRALTGR